MTKIDCEDVWGTMGTVSVGLFLVFCFIVLFSLCLKTGVVTHCFTEQSTEGVILKGYRSWDSDTLLGRFGSIHDAVAAAGEMHCPMLNPKTQPPSEESH